MIILTKEYLDKLNIRLKSSTVYSGKDTQKLIRIVMGFDQCMEETIKKWIDGDGDVEYILCGILSVHDVMNRLNVDFLQACSIVNSYINDDISDIEFCKENLENIYAME